MDLLFQPGALVFLLLAIAYVLGKKVIEFNEKRIHHISDEEYLALMAADRKCSEYDLFVLAAENWQAPPTQIEEDFKRYLIHGPMPHYVRDFVRKSRSEHDVEKNDRINPGGNLPASWSA